MTKPKNFAKTPKTGFNQTGKPDLVSPVDAVEAERRAALNRAKVITQCSRLRTGGMTKS